VIIISPNDITVNPAARTVQDIISATNTRLRLMGKAGWLADVENSIQNTVAAIDEQNPNRVNVNPSFKLSGVGRIFDFVNFVGFNFGNS
jgi:hypothetical protein